MKGKGTWNKVTSALARVSKEQLQIYTFKYCISCTNIFFTVKAKVLFNPDQAVHQNMRILAATFVTIHWKRTPSSCGQQLDKREPSFLQSPPKQLLPLSHTNGHDSSQTRASPKPESTFQGLSACMKSSSNGSASSVLSLDPSHFRGTNRSKGSSSSLLQRPGSFSPWKLRWIVPTVQSPASRGEKENDSGQTNKTQRCSLVKGFLYFDLLHILPWLKLCTYTSVLHRSENLSCFLPSSHAGSLLSLFQFSYQLAQPHQVHELLCFQPQCPAPQLRKIIYWAQQAVYCPQ